MLQRKASRMGAGLGKTTGWSHRASLKNRQVEMLTGVEYLRVSDAGLHIRVDGAETHRVDGPRQWLSFPAGESATPIVAGARFYVRRRHGPAATRRLKPGSASTRRATARSI